jgi:hypothetical protein
MHVLSVWLPCFNVLWLCEFKISTKCKDMYELELGNEFKIRFWLGPERWKLLFWQLTTTGLEPKLRTRCQQYWPPSMIYPHVSFLGIIPTAIITIAFSNNYGVINPYLSNSVRREESRNPFAKGLLSIFSFVICLRNKSVKSSKFGYFQHSIVQEIFF